MDSLRAELNQIAAIRLAITKNPKPSYSVDGENISWESYYNSLMDKQLVLEQAIQRAAGPFQIVSRGIT